MTGLFFGSFNPFHKGHLQIAQYLLSAGYCQQVWFVISPRNPMKEEASLLDEQKRLEIVQASIAGRKGMRACDIEFHMPKPSYTYATLQLLREKWPEEEFALIIGEDNLRNFHLWRDAEKIADRYKILVYPRRGGESVAASWEHVLQVDAPLADISSTEIRARLEQGQDVSSYVPAAALALVLEYYSSRKLLLHCCCAPCSAAILEWLLAHEYRPTLYYYNPNIFPREEYEIRKSECSRYARSLGVEMIDGDYDHSHWLEQVNGLESEPERGKRCLQCFRLRMWEAARVAQENGFHRFATTLASSRWKSLEQIAEAGHWAASQFDGVTFWEKNWRKGGLSERRRVLLAQNGFYNQQYCGCEFSCRRIENQDLPQFGEGDKR